MEIKGQKQVQNNQECPRQRALPGPNLTWSPIGFFVCLVWVFDFFFFFVESQKDENDLNEEQEIFNEMMRVIEQRDKLVDSLEEQRIKEKAEDQHFESFIFSRGCQLSRTWAGLGTPPHWAKDQSRPGAPSLMPTSLHRLCQTWN